MGIEIGGLYWEREDGGGIGVGVFLEGRGGRGDSSTINFFHFFLSFSFFEKLCTFMTRVVTSLMDERAGKYSMFFSVWFCFLILGLYALLMDWMVERRGGDEVVRGF